MRISPPVRMESGSGMKFGLQIFGDERLGDGLVDKRCIRGCCCPIRTIRFIASVISHRAEWLAGDNHCHGGVIGCMLFDYRAVSSVRPRADGGYHR